MRDPLRRPRYAVYGLARILNASYKAKGQAIRLAFGTDIESTTAWAR